MDSITNFSTDQERVIAEVERFLEADVFPCHALIGAAGTGKTTALRGVIRNIKGKICVAAPTHKAKLIASVATGLNTAHSLAELLGMAPNVDLSDFDPNKPQFAEQKEPKLVEYKLAIIDEASMVNQSLFFKIVNIAERSGTKVLFVGDTCQLPPVGEVEDSLALSRDMGFGVSELTRIIRQDEANPLSYVLAALRYQQRLLKGIEDEDGFEFLIDTLDRFGMSKFKGLDYLNLHNHRTELFETIVGSISMDIRDGQGFRVTTDAQEFIKRVANGVGADGKALAFTNSGTRGANAAIREKLGLKGQICINESLMAHRTLRAQGQPMILNAADYKVNEYRPFTNSYGVDCLKAELTSRIDGKIVELDLVSEQGWSRFEEIYWNAKALAAGSRNWKKFYEFRDCHAIMPYIIPDDFPEKLAIDMEYGYSITTHKSQGSTYPYVYIDDDDMGVALSKGDLKSKIFYLRLQYTAWSRAQKVVLMYQR